MSGLMPAQPAGLSIGVLLSFCVLCRSGAAQACAQLPARLPGQAHVRHLLSNAGACAWKCSGLLHQVDYAGLTAGGGPATYGYKCCERELTVHAVLSQVRVHAGVPCARQGRAQAARGRRRGQAQGGGCAGRAAQAAGRARARACPGRARRRASCARGARPSLCAKYCLVPSPAPTAHSCACAACTELLAMPCMRIC